MKISIALRVGPWLTTVMKTITTATRVYKVYQSSNLVWKASYQPINPKTGKAWQASRRIMSGNCYVLNNYYTGETTGVVIGNLPAFEVWTKVGKGMTGADTGYSTEALALAAVEAEKASSGK